MESYFVLNATTFPTVRKKIMYIMLTWWGLCLLLCYRWIRKILARLRKSYSVQCWLLHFRGLIWMKATFSSKSSIISYNLRAKFFYFYSYTTAQCLIPDFRWQILSDEYLALNISEPVKSLKITKQKDTETFHSWDELISSNFRWCITHEAFFQEA